MIPNDIFYCRLIILDNNKRYRKRFAGARRKNKLKHPPLKRDGCFKSYPFLNQAPYFCLAYLAWYLKP